MFLIDYFGLRFWSVRRLVKECGGGLFAVIGLVSYSRHVFFHLLVGGFGCFYAGSVFIAS